MERVVREYYSLHEGYRSSWKKNVAAFSKLTSITDQLEPSQKGSSESSTSKLQIGSAVDTEVACEEASIWQ